MGSYTLEHRPGLIRNTVRSLRRIPGGWVNQIGLRNPGLASVRFRSNRIYSLVGLEPDDWVRMFDMIPSRTHVEVNLGCPNVHEYGIPTNVLQQYCAKFEVGVKLPPTEFALKLARISVDAGVRYLHLSNTIPTLRGGESGGRLKQLNLPLIFAARQQHANIPIVAGGGIYSAQDVRDYEEAGASHFSLSTVWFTPWRVAAIKDAV